MTQASTPKTRSMFLSHDITLSRKLFPQVRRVVIKIGTSIVTAEGGTFALSRLGSIAEQISALMKVGVEVILVSSGSVVKGTQVLSEQQTLSKTMRNVHHRDMPPLQARACAAAGQSGMMAFYDALFGQKGLYVSQVLISRNDLKRLRHTIDTLLSVGVIPIVNENDALSTRLEPTNMFKCNDELAGLIATETSAELVILLTDVGGVYTKHPDEHGSELVSVWHPNANVMIGAKSDVGRGGMQSKIDAAVKAVNAGVPAVVIASGYKPKIINAIMKGSIEGTLFVKNPDELHEVSPSHVAKEVRSASLSLRKSSPETRSNILRILAQKLEDQQTEIMAMNAEDLSAAEMEGLTGSLFNRLKLTENKLESVVAGIRHLADAPDPLGAVLSRKEISADLELVKETCPLGVLLIIFESRPDVLPQIASLAIKSGNGVILKGGKEALRSNVLLHSIVKEAIEEGSRADDHMSSSLVTLIKDRADVHAYLQLNHAIDLVIPRGSYKMVRTIQNSTRIPVLGHAEGVCHIYVHADASLERAISIVLDSKLDYPSACNAVETVLVHSAFLEAHGAVFVDALLAANITIHAEEVAAIRLKGLGKTYTPLCNDFHHEYSDIELTLCEVDSIDAAVAHINTHGSGHTDCIITGDADSSIATSFQDQVDSACVFHNASTRFADGYRFGLGAEVGISTNRIHARGPVGVDGLMTTKWRLTSNAKVGHTVGQFTSGASSYTHVDLPLNSLSKEQPLNSLSKEPVFACESEVSSSDTEALY
eukprot:TRINITY_DN1567_c0_g1_i1.p1 TRINITY_DN1567_c0_g1~~TRINITY_DN1567_c0_g1_i1.p1  ORF type:complete len:767 (-),score=176.41 TRINITY_DN1567_c0_g1_i1:174-2474(-)